MMSNLFFLELLLLQYYNTNLYNIKKFYQNFIDDSIILRSCLSDEPFLKYYCNPLRSLLTIVEKRNLLIIKFPSHVIMKEYG